jgi:hypothetical protein
MSEVVLESWEEPNSVRWTSAYLKRLLIERHGIRASLENPGGSVITSATRKLETESQSSYSPVIGNDFHLDLLDAETEVNTLNAMERARLLAWCDGLSAQVAAEFASVRPGAIRKRQRTINKLVEDHNGAEDS